MNPNATYRKSLGAAAGAVAIALSLLLTSGTNAKAQKTIRAVMQADVQVLDPIVNTSDITARFAFMVYDTLFALDQNFVAQPQMVGDYKVSEDKLTYDFTLRPGLKFHDGSPVTSADVIASLKRWEVRDGAGQLLAKFTKELSQTGDQSFRLVLNEPYGLVLDPLTKPDGNVPIIMP